MSHLPPPVPPPADAPTDAPRERALNVPWPVLAVVALLAAVHAARALLDPAADAELTLALAFVPARFADLLGLDPLGALAAEAAPGDRAAAARLAYGRALLAEGARPLSALTYAGLHAGLAHLGMNCLWLVAFGGAVARRFGPARFLALMALAAVAGALAHLLARPLDLVPVIGASASVSAAMGAAARFAFGRPAPGEAPGPVDALAPALPLRGVLRERGARGFVLAWFAITLLTGLLGGLPGEGLSIAWEAHIGGFLLGLLAFRAFDPVPRGGVAPAAR